MDISRRNLLAGGVGLAGASVWSGVLQGSEKAPNAPRDAIVLVAEIKAKAGEEEAVKKALQIMGPPTRKEEGCLCYNLHQSSKDATQFMFYEQWVDQDALKAHGQTPHMKAMREAIKGRVEKGGATRYELIA